MSLATVTMDIRGAIFKVDNDDDEVGAEDVASVSGSARGRTLTRDSDSVEDRRKNFRSATYAYSSDRTTIEDMADHVISRFVTLGIDFWCLKTVFVETRQAN